jgi:electron transport complex protein RnfA
MDEMLKQAATIMLMAVLTDNFILSKFLGICPFLGVSKKASNSLGMGLAVIFVMVLASLVTWPIYTYVLTPLDAQFMDTMAFIVVIAMLVQLLEMFLKRYVNSLYKSLGVYLPLLTTNCAVLGVTLLNITSEYNLAESVWNAFCSGLGFLLVMLVFAGVRGRLEQCDVPKSFEGTPITLIAASIVSLSFVGFGGIVDGIFGVV